jgi:hypothetical protein
LENFSRSNFYGKASLRTEAGVTSMARFSGELKQNHFYGKFFWRINAGVTAMAQLSGELRQE